MKPFLNRMVVFQYSIQVFAFFARRPRLNYITSLLTCWSAQLNLLLNRPKPEATPLDIANTWQKLMPADAQDQFVVKSHTAREAITEIRIHCPLRNTGDHLACRRLMEYDRKLIESIGGEMEIVESQSNSGKSFCTLAIRMANKP